MIPLVEFDNPQTLGAAIATEDGDTFADDPASDGCHYIPLTPET